MLLQRASKQLRSFRSIRQFSKYENAKERMIRYPLHPAEPLSTHHGILGRVNGHKSQHHRKSEQVHISMPLTTILMVSGACLASSEQTEAYAASNNSRSSKSDDNEDLFEQLKKKIQSLAENAVDDVHKTLSQFSESPQNTINEFLASGKGGQISWGFMMGVCSGFALKKVSKVGAVALGSVFVMFQMASYSGYINVDHKKIEKDVLDILDINKDGQFDTKDLNEVYKSVMEVLEFSMPAGSGFAVGFLFGFRSG